MLFSCNRAILTHFSPVLNLQCWICNVSQMTGFSTKYNTGWKQNACEETNISWQNNSLKMWFYYTLDAKRRFS